MPNSVVVSYSELDTFRQCPLKHQLAYVQRWTKPPAEGRALARGTLWHKTMEAHYRALQESQTDLPGFSIPKTDEPAILDRVWRTDIQPLLYDTQTGQQTPDQKLIEWMYRGYVEVYGADRQWKILQVERSAQIPLPADSGRPSSRYRLKIKIDLLVEDREGRRWLVDHKSGAELPNRLELDIDDQFGLYTAALRSLNWPVFGAIHSAARTRQLKGDEDGTKPTPLEKRYLRTPIYRSETELRNLLLDAGRAARAAYATGPVFSSPSPDRCKWRCDFLDAHMAMRKGIPVQVALADFGFHVDKSRH